MSIVVVVVCIVGGLSLALLVMILRKLDGLPARVWAIARHERERDESLALTALQEATAAKVGTMTAALRQYEEQVAATLRAQVADAQARARAAERRLSDTGSALEAATALVRELRAALDEARVPSAPRFGASEEPVHPKADGAALGDADQRETVEMPKPPASCEPPASDDEPEEELTTIAARPPPGTTAASNGLRFAPRPKARPAVLPASGEGEA
ncbi:MAG: hypothetical protein QM820_29720 [Minicystis sp.]